MNLVNKIKQVIEKNKESATLLYSAYDEIKNEYNSILNETFNTVHTQLY